MPPILLWELVLSGHDLPLHMLSDLLGGRLRVEGRVATKHNVDDHAQTPHVAALVIRVWRVPRQDTVLLTRLLFLRLQYLLGERQSET